MKSIWKYLSYKNSTLILLCIIISLIGFISEYIFSFHIIGNIMIIGGITVILFSFFISDTGLKTKLLKDFIFTILLVIVLCINVFSFTSFINSNFKTENLDFIGTMLSSLLSALITIITVVGTLNANENQRKKDKALELKPILKVITNADKMSKETDFIQHNEIKNFSIGKIFKYKFVIKNIGRGECNNLRLKRVYIKELGCDFVLPKKDNSTVSILPINFCISYDLNLQVTNELLGNLKELGDCPSATFIFVFEYENIFGDLQVVEFSFYHKVLDLVYVEVKSELDSKSYFECNDERIEILTDSTSYN